MTTKYLVYFTIIFLLFSCDNVEKNTEHNNTVPVRITVVSSKPYQKSFFTTGIVQSKTQMKLSFKTGGIIDKIYVDEGEKVAAGQILASLKTTEIAAKAGQAELAYEKALRDYKRAENLYKDSVITLELFENAKTQLDIANENLNIAKFNLEHAKIFAPSTGSILKKLASENEVIGAGYPVLAMSTEGDSWIVKSNCSDKQIVNVSLGDSAVIFIDAYPDKKFYGVVSEIASAADPYTGTYEIEIKFNSKGYIMKNGFVAKVQLFINDKENKLFVPVESLTDVQGNNAWVYVLKNKKPEKTNISFIDIENNYVIVDSGIKANDTIITDGANYIDENSNIKLIN
ncbi:MAG: efflux RND transporter periplasmic adaptor subunit [Marinilabiliales bacterium]